jgi:hypothetical protein
MAATTNEDTDEFYSDWVKYANLGIARIKR